jgi:hypothetical protein
MRPCTVFIELDRSNADSVFPPTQTATSAAAPVNKPRAKVLEELKARSAELLDQYLCFTQLQDQYFGTFGPLAPPGNLTPGLPPGWSQAPDGKAHYHNVPGGITTPPLAWTSQGLGGIGQSMDEASPYKEPNAKDKGKQPLGSDPIAAIKGTTKAHAQGDRLASPYNIDYGIPSASSGSSSSASGTRGTSGVPSRDSRSSFTLPSDAPPESSDSQSFEVEHEKLTAELQRLQARYNALLDLLDRHLNLNAELQSIKAQLLADTGLQQHNDPGSLSNPSAVPGPSTLEPTHRRPRGRLNLQRPTRERANDYIM